MTESQISITDKPTPRVFKARGKQLVIGERTLVMGIVNVTPDSFSDGGDAYNLNDAVERTLRLVEEGAEIVDIGGESTRPGSEPATLEVELGRVIPVIEAVSGRINALISIDTYKAEVARQALMAGAHIVNDISGGNFSQNMTNVVAEFDAGVVLMHIQGTPRNMQQNPHYDDLIGEIRDYLFDAVQRFKALGIQRESILVDPGIGFGKNLEHNLALLKNAHAFSDLAAGVLIGPSRKSFIGLLTDRPVKERLEGTIAAAVICSLHGADIIRVHDVKPVINALKVADAIKTGSCTQASN